jgi:hypothetical protein
MLRFPAAMVAFREHSCRPVAQFDLSKADDGRRHSYGSHWPVEVVFNEPDGQTFFDVVELSGHSSTRRGTQAKIQQMAV